MQAYEQSAVFRREIQPTLQPLFCREFIRTDVTSNTLNVCHHGPWMVHCSSRCCCVPVGMVAVVPPPRTRSCRMSLLLIVSLVVIGGLMLLLGRGAPWWSVVALTTAVTMPRGRAQAGHRAQVLMAAAPQKLMVALS